MNKIILNFKSYFKTVKQQEDLKFKITFHNRRNNAGFTLIETFIAITILIIAMAGPLTLVTKGLSISKIAKSQITSMYLAQEAIEYIRNIRDNNILNERSWTYGLTDCIGSKCKIDSPNESIDSCSNDCENLKYNSSSYLFGYSTGDESRFRREVQITEITANKELEIVVNMFWIGGPNEHQFTIKERLFNWQ